MNRRQALVLLAAAVLPTAAGCNTSLRPKAAKKKVDPYTAVAGGMSVRDVVKLMGEPKSRRELRLEGTGPQATQLTWVGHHQLTTVIFVRNQVVAKHRT